MGETLAAQHLPRLKQLIVDRLRLDRAPDSIGDEDLLFHPDGLGLDSIDALELVLGIEQEFGIRIANEEVGSEVMATPARLATFLEERLREQPSE